MSPLQAQLAELRRRMAAASARADAQMAAREPSRPDVSIENWVSGQVVETAWGRHFECERAWDGRHRHGSADIGALAELPAALLAEISGGEVPDADPAEWAFLDTETSGLAGGSGACAFLVGVGRIVDGGFRLRQFFMRDFDEEASMLGALAAELEDARTLITYNGKAFDVPLLETRYRLRRARPPFAWMSHLDLLHGARRLWRLRLESCRLVELENRVLGFERDGDVPGETIPHLYFEYLRLRTAARLAPVFEHNALDILTLACLTSIVPRAFREPGASLRDGAEMVSMGRWLRQGERVEEALDLFRQALGKNLRDDLLFRTLWDLALLERKQGRASAAIAIFTELAGVPNPHRTSSLVELAKHYEHGEKNLAMALEFCEAALAGEESADLLRRRERLRRLASRPRSARLL